MRSERGYGLVEVLVALSLFGLGILLFLRFSLQAQRLWEQSRSLSEALVLAQSEMERLEAFGWDEAASSLPSAAEERAGTSRRLAERQIRGRVYLVSLERQEGPAVDRLTVTCRSLAGRGAGRGTAGVALVTARRRRR